MKKKLFFLMIVTFLTFVLLACTLSNIKVASAQSTYILSDGFESGNLSSWTDYAGTLSINSQTVNSGSYSVQNNVVGNNENLYNQSLGGSLPNPIDFREYVYITSTTVPSTSGDYYEVGGFAAIGRPDFGDGEICVFNVNHVLYWGVYYRDNNVTTGTTPGFGFSISTDNSTSNATPVSLGWSCVELKHTTGASSTSYGHEQLYINGVSILNVAVDNYDRTPYYAVIGGSQLIAKNTDSWNYYLDDVAVSGSYIGPLQYQLTMSTNFGTVTPLSGSYNESQVVTITATTPTPVQGERYIFQGWTGTGPGSYTGPNNPSTANIEGNITETATWEHQYYLTVTSVYGSVSGGGWVDAGTSQVVSVSPTTVPGTAGTQYVFTGWSGDASGTSSNSNPIMMNGSKTATANWQTQYLLNVTSDHGTVGGSGYYASGANVTATVSPLTVAGAAGTQYVFTGWSGNASGTTSPSNNITMNGPLTATANWQTQYNLTIAQSGVASDFSGNFIAVNGTAYSRAGFSTWANPGNVYTFSYMPLLNVTANSEQYVLTGISGNSTSSSLTISSPTTVVGAYQAQYYLTATSTYGSVSPSSGWFNNGSSITEFVASPIAGAIGTQYACIGWTGTGSIPASGGTSAVTFTINAASSITWNWQTQYLISFVSNPSGIGTISPSGTNVWENPGTLSIFATTSLVDYRFSSWSADTGSITFEIPSASSTVATINGPGTITANFASAPTPTPTPVPTVKPTNSPSPSPKSTPTISPTHTPSSSPTHTSTPANGNATILYVSVGVVIAIVVVGLATVLFLRRKKLK
jgi:uncharacterized repeat protein (TIGR02543 family)